MCVLFSALVLAETTLGPLLHASQWIGASPTAQTLSGKVVVVDVFTYSCINCKHVVPELRRLRARYDTSNLVIIGIHTPELPSDRVRATSCKTSASRALRGRSQWTIKTRCGRPTGSNTGPRK